MLQEPRCGVWFGPTPRWLVPPMITPSRGCTMTHLELDISGMSCNHCVGAVTKALQSVHGVVVEQVAIGKATISYDAEATSPAQIALAIEDEGFAVLTSP